MSRALLCDELGRRIMPASVLELQRQVVAVLLGKPDDPAATCDGERLLTVRYDGASWDDTEILHNVGAALTLVGIPGAIFDFDGDDVTIRVDNAALANLRRAYQAVCDSAARGSVAYLDGRQGDYTGALAALANGTDPEVDRTGTGRRVEHYHGTIQVTETHRAKWWVTVIGGVEPVVSAVVA